MTHRLLGYVELTYGATRSIDRLTAAIDTATGVIMREVIDPPARAAALALVAQALGVAVRGVAAA